MRPFASVANAIEREVHDAIGGLRDETAFWKRRALAAETRAEQNSVALERALRDNSRLEAENAVLQQRASELTMLAAGRGGETEAALRKRITELEHKVADLTVLLLEAQREAKRQAAPFRRKRVKRRRRKPGRKAGHPGARRQVPEHVDETRSSTIDTCPDCQAPLRGIEDHVNYAIELPVIIPLIIAYLWQSGHCPKCRRQKRSRHPEQPSHAQGAALVSLGPRAIALAITLKVRHAVAFRRVAELYVVAFGLQFTAGALAQALQRIGRRLEPTYKALLAALELSDAVFVDETGWRVLRVTAWLWVFTTKDVTVYIVDHRRNHEVPLGVLGKSYAGIIHHDGARLYDSLPYLRHQTCNEHILRDLDELAEIKAAGAVRWPRAVAELLREAIALRKKEGTSPVPVPPGSAANDIEERLDRLLMADLSDADNVRMRNRLERNRDLLFTFLYRDEAEPTTARAEQQIRPMVVNRRNGACNRSWAGALALQVVASVIATSRQQGHNPYEVLQEAATSHPKGHVINRLIPPSPPRPRPTARAASPSAPPAPS